MRPCSGREFQPRVSPRKDLFLDIALDFARTVQGEKVLTEIPCVSMVKDRVMGVLRLPAQD